MRRAALLALLALGACGSDAGGAGGSPRGGGGQAGAAGATGGQDAGGGGMMSGGTSGARDAGAAGAPGPDGPPATAELGQGPSPFQPLAPGQRMPIIPGSQGLPMLVFAVKASGIEPGDADHPTLRDPLLVTACVNIDTGMEVGSGRKQQGMRANPDGTFEFSDGWTPFLAAEAQWRGKRLRCTGTIIDANNRRATDVKEVTAGP